MMKRLMNLQALPLGPFLLLGRGRWDQIQRDRLVLESKDRAVSQENDSLRAEIARLGAEKDLESQRADIAAAKIEALTAQMDVMASEVSGVRRGRQARSLLGDMTRREWAAAVEEFVARTESESNGTRTDR